MASISKDGGGGKRRILFTNGNGDRKTIRLGKMPLADARTIKHHIESLLAAKLSGCALDNKTAAWVRNMPNVLADKLAAVELIEKRKTTTLGDMLQNFLKSHPGKKPATVALWETSINDLKNHYGTDYSIQSIGPKEADGFRQKLIDDSLAPATIQRRLQHVKQFFAFAVRRELIEKNPFQGITHGGGDPRERQHYISPEDTLRLLEAAPNHVWRTIIALSRYAGLRCPSEILSLRLTDVDWERGSIRVTAPKTECHAGHGSRIIPIFGRLRPYLLDAFEQAEVGQVNVIPEKLYLSKCLGKNGWNGGNLRHSLRKIIDRAGLTPWPRPFHNLRASCESDLAGEYPIATACRWLGNTVAIAARHDIQTTDNDFQRAIKGTQTRASHNPSQYMQQLASNDTKAKQINPIFPDVYATMPGVAANAFVRK